MTTYMKKRVLLSRLVLSQIALCGCAAVAGGVAGAAIEKHHIDKQKDKNNQ
jgi:hypothetical protein